MDTKFFHLSLFFIGTFIFTGCKECEGDTFGEQLDLMVPINTTPSEDVFSIGDTLWVVANIDKEVMVKDSEHLIRLDNFNFFTEMVISEISDTVEYFDIDIEIIETIGEVSVLPLTTAISYPLQYEEEANAYRLRAGIIFNEPGLYLIGFQTFFGLFEEYEHPAMYYCEDQRRTKTTVTYQNTSTSLNNFDNIFGQTQVSYHLEQIDYERFAQGGAHAILVQ
ncbi:hypothetical protein [Lewinella sp. LCG006]|uniref:hypothetical protein n=1 Tax=Lewinella sp. LCG006 TaxID=3231911 RepID=UPI0034604DD4